MLPVISCIQFNSGSLISAVCLKLYFDWIRSLAILVVRIIPLLFNLDTRWFRSVLVRDRKAILGIARYACFVSVWYLDLFYCIRDLLTIILLCKVCPLMLPVISCIQFNDRSLWFVVCLQLYLDRIRSLAILVIRIVPHLMHRCTRGFRVFIHYIHIKMHRCCRIKIRSMYLRPCMITCICDNRTCKVTT